MHQLGLGMIAVLLSQYLAPGSEPVKEDSVPIYFLSVDILQMIADQLEVLDPWGPGWGSVVVSTHVLLLVL